MKKILSMFVMAALVTGFCSCSDDDEVVTYSVKVENSQADGIITATPVNSPAGSHPVTLTAAPTTAISFRNGQ